MEKRIETALSKEELKSLFRKAGVTPGMILEVHVALSKFGFCIGGAQTFNDALIEVLGYSGTIIMPLQAGGRSEPSYFEHPPMDFSLHQKFRDHLPAFDPHDSDSEFMSKVAENLRRREKAVVSNHPTTAFVAYGKYARLLCGHQELSFSLNDSSPLGRLYELKASCLLAGVSYDNMTSLHLSEYRSMARPLILQGSAILKNGHRVWEKYFELDVDSEEFLNIGKRLEEKRLVHIEPIPHGEMRLLRVDVAVDEGMRYFDEKMKYYNG